MKFRLVTVAAATAALSFAVAGSAVAQPLGHKPAPPPQVTGTQLWNALVPISAFGSDFVQGRAKRSGSTLLPGRATLHIPSQSCVAFQNTVNIEAYGDTAGVAVQYSNPDWRSSYPDTTIIGQEYVLQFATTALATTFYNQSLAKYAACTTVTMPIGSITATVNTLSVTKTTVSGDRAFVVTQLVNAGRLIQKPLYQLFLYVVAGTTVYSLGDIRGNNDEPSVALMTELIHRVQALYGRH
jgi:hypothetical protein